MLPGSVRDNITFYDDTVPDSAMCEALALSQEHSHGLGSRLHPDLTIRPDNISAGEACVIANARALSTAADLLMFDEPWRNLGADAIASSARFLAGLRDRKTVVIISHERKLLDLTDQVLSL